MYLWGIVMSIWSTHRPSGGDGTGLTVSIRRPESRLLQSAGQRPHKHFHYWIYTTAVLIQSIQIQMHQTRHEDTALLRVVWMYQLIIKQQALDLRWRRNKPYCYEWGWQRNAPQASGSNWLSAFIYWPDVSKTVRRLLNVRIFWKFWPKDAHTHLCSSFLRLMHTALW